MNAASKPFIEGENLAIAAIATTPQGAHLCHRLSQILPLELWVPQSLEDYSGATAYSSSLSNHLKELWPTRRAIVFVLATGAVVRLIAPLLKHKETDPAVVVLDEKGTVAISLCGGHQAGADDLARNIAQALGATPVLTGAANALELPGIDILGNLLGWNKGTGDWTGVSAAIARQELVEVLQDAGAEEWQKHLPPHHTFQWGETIDPQRSPTARVWVSPIQRKFASSSSTPKVQWHPRVLWLGIGCERGTSRAVIEQGVQRACQFFHLAEGAIAGVATLDLKADETGLLELCRDRQWPLVCFDAEDLRQVTVPNPSSVVEREVGTPSVAEAAAWLAAQRHSLEHEALGTVSEPDLRVPKQVMRIEGEPGAATVAIAQSDREYTGRKGRLGLVGIGPGDLSQMTGAAQMAIAQADVVIGYSLYVDLIRPILRPGQWIESLPITQEQARAERAIALAQWGLTVAVISSGDCGIYGMAGLVLEQLRQRHWDGQTPSVAVFPGVSAFQSAAARTGTPLMHDFCAISLSDLLTPWPVIETRLKAAAQADFVVALYNPKSKTRTEQIALAQCIFLQYRSPETPVAIVRSAYREDEHITLTTLEECLNHPIDMMTLVLIGNQSTKNYQNWLITPRGYLGFESEPNPITTTSENRPTENE